MPKRTERPVRRPKASPESTEGELKGGGKASKAKKPQRGKGKGNRIDAMSHPLRARVLRTLVERGVMSPAELTRALGADLSDVSYHVRRLEELECVELVSTRPVRGALEHFYRATERHLIDTDEWEQLDPITAEGLVCGYIQRILDDFVASRKAGIVGFDRWFHITRTPLILDKEGFLEGMDILETARLQMAEVERKSAERRAESGEPGVPTSSSLVYFKVPRRALDT